MYLPTLLSLKEMCFYILYKNTTGDDTYCSELDDDENKEIMIDKFSGIFPKQLTESFLEMIDISADGNEGEIWENYSLWKFTRSSRTREDIGYFLESVWGYRESKTHLGFILHEGLDENTETEEKVIGYLDKYVKHRTFFLLLCKEVKEVVKIWIKQDIEMFNEYLVGEHEMKELEKHRWKLERLLEI